MAEAKQARRSGPGISRGQVVDAALRLLNEVGLEGLTLRRLAQELGVRAPALYWHVRNKRELLDEMATALLRVAHEEAADGPGAGEPGAGGGAGAEPVADWEAGLLAVHRQLRRVLLRYRDGAKVFGGTRLTDTGHIPWQEGQLARMVDAGFPPEAAARAGFLVFAFTEGFVIEEQAVHPLPGERDPGYDVAERTARIGAEHPLAARAGEVMFGDGADFEERFEEGLAALVAGIKATMAPRR